MHITKQKGRRYYSLSRFVWNAGNVIYYVTKFTSKNRLEVSDVVAVLSERVYKLTCSSDLTLNIFKIQKFLCLRANTTNNDFFLEYDSLK